LYAQEIIPVKGVVFNEKTHEPLTGVEIWVEETGHFAISDDNGFFQFMRLKPGFYHLHFYRIGFQPQRKQIHVVSESSLHIEILLKPDILVSDTIQVIASRQNFRISAEGSKFVFYLDSLTIQGHSILQLLEKIPGVTLLKDDRGSVRILMKGTLTDYVKVMIDGIDISNPQTGEVDLSIISEQQVEKIEVYQGGNASFFGSQAIGGAINFITKKTSPHTISMGNSIGSFGFYKNQEAVFKEFSKRKNVGITFSYSEADNEYSYQYEGKEYLRKNNSYIDRNFSIKTNNIFLPSRWKAMNTKIFLNYFHRNHQLPGTYYHFDQPQYARSMEDYLISAIQIKFKPGTKVAMENKLEWMKYLGEFDGHSERYFRFWTVNKNSRLKNTISMTIRPAQGIETRQFFEWLEETIRVEDRLNPFVSITPKKRILRSGFGSLNFMKKFAGLETFWTASVRYQEYRQKWKPYPFFQGVLVWSYLGVTIQTGISYAENFKFPDLNSLFWVSSARALGNPDLKPELGINRQIEFNLDFQKLPVNLHFTRFTNDISNFIFWEPDFRGIWKPKNLGLSKITGYSVHVRTYWKNAFEGVYDYYFQKPINLTPGTNSYKKIIPYLFRYQHKIHITLHLPYVDVTVFTRWNSGRESLMANSPQTQMPAFSVTDIQLQGKMKIAGLQLSLALEVNNIWNENYDLVLGYPMPGRHYIITCWLKK
jgi:outer membrane cobalamin receptor